MNILVCVKQVPDTIKVRFDADQHTLIRQGDTPFVINPFDLYALEAAARLKDEDPSCHLAALCMGPEQAGTVLRDALAFGADDACLVSDERFAGSDATASAHILSRAIDRLEEEMGKFDAIFCGAKSTDGGTSSLGVMLAGLRGLPVLAYALSCAREGDGLKVLQECDEAKLYFHIPFSCVVTFTKASFAPRYPLMARVIAAQSTPLISYRAEDLGGIDYDRIGYEGSLTHVEAQRYRELKKKSRTIKAKSPESGAKKLAMMMSEAHVI